MFYKGDYLKYGAQGIFQVKDIRPIRFGPGAPLQRCYVLQPIAAGGAQVFVPADNPLLTERMQPVPTAEEIDRIIQSVRGHSLPWISDHKERAAGYQQILTRRSEPELLLLIGCLYQQSCRRAKGLSPADSRILKEAKGIIDEEFSFSLCLPAEEVGSYIRSRLT